MLKTLTILAAAALALSFAGAAAGPASSDSLTNPKHFFWAPGQNPNASLVDTTTNDLIYHGGNGGPGAIGVEQKPAVYLIFWGPQWAQGFKTADTNGKLYSSSTLITYVKGFFAGIGGSKYAGVQTQYCKGVPAGATSCVGGTGFVTNPLNQLKGTWIDSTPVPSDIIASGLAQNLVDDPIAAEAMRASAHFKYDSSATYIVLTPPTTVATGQPVYCGYHTQTTAVDALGNPYRIQYAFIPFLNLDWPGLGTGGCGMHSVNATSDAYGNGIFDGYSVVTGHEYAEAVTDPDNFSSFQDGWNDAQTSENGDKCAWTNLRNISLGGHAYAVQPLWSNENFDRGGSGCVFSR